MSSLRKNFVAEISGNSGDLLAGRDGRLVQEALADHAVVAIRGLKLDPAEQVMLTRVLGEPEVVTDMRNHHADSVDVLVVNNSGETPVVGNKCWHSDRSFLVHPTRYTLLRAAVVPDRGGDTLFADMAGAYGESPPSWQKSLSEAIGIHSYDKIARLRAEVHNRPIELDYAKVYPPVRHPLVRVHPESGTPALYLNELCLAHIESRDGTSVEVTLDELNAYATHERFVYRHRWQVGDLLIWDNSRVMHRADALRPGLSRVMHRTTTRGDRPHAAGPSSAAAE